MFSDGGRVHFCGNPSASRSYGYPKFYKVRPPDPTATPTPSSTRCGAAAAPRKSNKKCLSGSITRNILGSV
eukprot:1150343-Prorocentrum_minimum.AAC.2